MGLVIDVQLHEKVGFSVYDGGSWVSEAPARRVVVSSTSPRPLANPRPQFAHVPSVYQHIVAEFWVSLVPLKLLRR